MFFSVIWEFRYTLKDMPIILADVDKLFSADKEFFSIIHVVKIFIGNSFWIKTKTT